MSHFICYLSSCAVITLVFLLLIKLQRKKTFRLPYPPGPKGLPLIGNLCDVPQSREWLTFSKWSRDYNSSVIHLNLLGTHLIVLNTAEAVSELLDKRSGIYSDRPRLPMITELIGFDLLTFYQYGKKFRDTRRMFHRFFNRNTIADYQRQETKATRELLYRLARKPEDFRELIRLMAGSLILDITYGIDVQSVDDPYILMMETTMNAFSQTVNPGSFLVNTIPLLKHVPEWVPGAGFKKRAREWRKVVEAATEAPNKYVQNSMEKGTHNLSITSQVLEEFKGNKEMEDTIRSMGLAAYAGGADTTAAVLEAFFLAMVLHSDVVRTAQEELDLVVGYERLPEASDKPFLPYTCAIMKEVLRWMPMGPLAFAHRLRVDDVYEGRLLPAGSLVFGNAWAILHDESIYKDPETFNPDRFLKDGKLDPTIRSPETAAFGFGRRICPGQHLALSTIFLNIACILATFDIGMAIDKNGKPIIPSKEFTSGVICRPFPFKCSIKHRSPNASDIIAEAYETHHTQS